MGPRVANGPIDDELHATTDCKLMAAKRVILYIGKILIFNRLSQFYTVKVKVSACYVQLNR